MNYRIVSLSLIFEAKLLSPDFPDDLRESVTSAIEWGMRLKGEMVVGGVADARIDG